MYYHLLLTCTKTYYMHPYLELILWTATIQAYWIQTEILIRIFSWLCWASAKLILKIAQNQISRASKPGKIIAEHSSMPDPGPTYVVVYRYTNQKTTTEHHLITTNQSTGNHCCSLRRPLLDARRPIPDLVTRWLAPTYRAHPRHTLFISNKRLTSDGSYEICSGWLVSIFFSPATIFMYRRPI